MTADWLMEKRDNTVCHVVVTAVTEMGQLCCRRAPPGPWSGLTLGPGWGSGPGSRRRAAPGPRSLQTVLPEAKTTPLDRRSL